MKQFLLAMPLAMLPVTAIAQDVPVLAQYWTDSGSLPPEYAWETSVTIFADHSLTLRHCTGYETEGPACKTRKAKVTDDQIQAILTAATESGLLQTPARDLPEDMIPVGGGVTGGSVTLDGQVISLVAFPAVEDAARVAMVLQAIHAAIPERLRQRFMDES